MKLIPFIVFPILLFGCAGIGDTESSPDQIVATGKSEEYAPQKVIAKVYLETSASNDGYYSPNSSFNQRYRELITNLNTDPNVRDLFIYDAPNVPLLVYNNSGTEAFAAYLGRLTIDNFEKTARKGNSSRTSSDLGKLLFKVLDSNHKNAISVLVSDMVISTGGSNDAIDFQALLQKKFADRLAQPFATLLMKYTSSFNGLYYPAVNSKGRGRLATSDRPYYFLIVGPYSNLKELAFSAAAQNGKDFSSFYLLAGKPNFSPTAGIIPNVLYYNVTRPGSLDVSDAHLGAAKKDFQLTVGINFENIPVTEAYLRNPDNYSFPANYELKIDPTNKFKAYSHILTLTAKRFKAQDAVELKLLNKTPEWVIRSSSNNDANIFTDKDEQKRTFGFLNMVNGIEKAYKQRGLSDDAYFSLHITIKD